MQYSDYSQKSEEKSPCLAVASKCLSRSQPLPPAGSGDMRGPTKTSNWVIPGRLLTGSYPGEYSTADTRDNIKKLLRAGVTLVVPLVDSWLLQYYPYVKEAEEIAEKEFHRKLSFNYFPIEDLSTADEEELLQFIPHLADIIREGKEVVYVHCYSGHGRSGIIISLLLSLLYNIDGREALKLTNHCHSQREYAGYVHSPETSEQCDQVKKVARMLKKHVKK